MGRRKKGAPPNIHPRTDKEVYEATVYVGGRRHRPQLATFAEVERLGEEEGAKLLTQRYNAAVEHLLDTTPASRDERSRVRLSAAWESFEGVMAATRSKGTLAYYGRTLAELRKAAGDPLLADFSIRHVDKLVAYLRSDHTLPNGSKAKALSPASVNIRLQVISAFLHWAQERDYIERIPRIRQLPKERKLPRVPADEDLAALLHHLRHPPHDSKVRSYRLHLRAFMVAAGTGMRLSEVFYLRWDHIDFEEGVIHVRYQQHFSIKERREKNPPMPPFLLAFLHAEHEGKGEREVWLLDNGRGKLAFWSPKALSLAFRRHYDAIGVPPERRPKAFHGFRALYATKLYNEMGVDIGTIRRLLGHADIKTTEGYFADTRTEEKRAVARLRLTATETPPGSDDFFVKPPHKRARG